MQLTTSELATLGEGPIWDQERNCLWWIDIIGKKLHQYDPAENQNKTFELDQKPGTVVIAENGKLALALFNGFYSFNPANGSCELITNPEEHKPATRFNDGKCDPAGRFWAGTMEDAETGQNIGSLYSLSNNVATKHLDDVGISNGIVWNSTKDTMYYIDSPTRTVFAFDYNHETAEISNRRPIVVTTEEQGYPDGMSIDSEDKIWVCMWAGWKVIRFDPADGSVLDEVEVPVRNVTACAFGGHDLKDLYITTARKGNEDFGFDKQPNAGGLFKTRVDVAGTTFPKFAG